MCDWYSPRRGGIEAHLDGLATRLIARGHSVIAITSTPGPDQVNGVRVYRLATPRAPLAGVTILPPVREIRRILAAERISLVHSHVSIVSPVALAGAAAARKLSLASVLTFHSFIPGTPIFAALAGLALGTSRWNAQMTAVSRRVAREVEPFAAGSTFTILPNAVDTKFWIPPAGRRGDGAVRLVYAGRLAPKKRPLLLLRALRELAGVEQPWTLTIVGEGPLEPSLRAGVRELKLEDRVNFTGWVEPEVLRGLLQSADVFLSTAERESFGLAALEARACGLAVVAVDDSAVADFVTHEVSGLLARTDQDFAAATARLVRDAELRLRITEHNRREPVPYDWDRTVAAHEEAYGRAEAAVSGATADRSFQLPSA